MKAVFAFLLCTLPTLRAQFRFGFGGWPMGGLGFGSPFGGFNWNRGTNIGFGGWKRMNPPSAGGWTPFPGGGGMMPGSPGGGMMPSTPGGGTMPSSPGGGMMPSSPGGGTMPSSPGGGMIPPPAASIDQTPGAQPPAQTPPGAGGSGPAAAAHNPYRLRHGVVQFTEDPNLTAFATSYAQRCVFQHSQKREYGENLYMSSGMQQSPQEALQAAVDSWYSEVSSYRYGSDFSPSSGHFTQMVWASSTSVGCGVANCNGGQVIVVCNYYPRGNVMGQFAQNVRPAIR